MSRCKELGVQPPVGFWDPAGLSKDGDVEVSMGTHSLKCIDPSGCRNRFARLCKTLQFALCWGLFCCCQSMQMNGRKTSRSLAICDDPSQPKGFGKELQWPTQDILTAKAAPQWWCLWKCIIKDQTVPIHTYTIQSNDSCIFWRNFLYFGCLTASTDWSRCLPC